MNAPNAPAPGQTEKFGRLRTVLREMFQLDRGDLDFGLYRIMNLKRAEVERFLSEDLLPQVQEILEGAKGLREQAAAAELADGKRVARTLGVNPDRSPVLQTLGREVAGHDAVVDSAEGDVYKHLASFFERYYRDGDFSAQRRYSSGGQTSYLIPYDGEEVKLHWANADQFYIKTTENYASYVFRPGPGAESGSDADRRVRFEIAAAVGSRDNVKEANGRTRRFVLAKGLDAVGVDGGNLVVRFEHRPLTDGEKRRFPGNGNTQQARLNEEAAARIERSAPAEWQASLSHPEPTDSSPDRTTLDRHLAAYTAKNSFDYFIHKDLGGFLRRELDLYLKTEVLNLDDLQPENTTGMRRALALMTAIRTLGEKVIAFLAQLEDFQKLLWLKKKFVLETQYCVTLDRVPEAFYAEIAANSAQREEWESLYAISEIPAGLMNGGGGAGPLTEHFLRANPYLVLDTRHFEQDFKDRLLAGLSDTGSLDEAQDGLLVHGENFQALNLLMARYRGGIQCVYIDPPYNSNTTAILYKNSYRHSSWITLMENRLSLSGRLANPNGSHVVAIDENEQELLGYLLTTVLPDHAKICVSVIHNKKGIQGAHFSYVHDYAYFCIAPGLKKSYGFPIADEDRDFAPLRKWGRESERHTARNCFYPIVVEDGEIVDFGEVCPANFHPQKANIAKGDSVLIYPIDAGGIERKWRYARDSVESIRDLLRVRVVVGSGEIQIEKSRIERTVKTVWDDPKYIAGDFGTRWLSKLGLKVEQDLYPKSVHTVMDSVFAVSDEDAIVLDYFAGSGTTGHAVVNLNRSDGGRRRYLLVEMGEHFDTVILPRLKKIVYSPDWKDGKPISRKGISQFSRYLRLESYEDTMDSLTVVPRNEADLGLQPELVEDYRLRYALSAETNGSASLLGSEFEDPFAYTLSVVRDGERRETPVDLPETFNLLLGLREASRRRLDGVLAIEGEDAEGLCCLILWRNRRETNNRALDAWFLKHRSAFGPFDRVYANGDHTLNAVAEDEASWRAFPIEPDFRRLMFEED